MEAVCFGEPVRGLFVVGEFGEFAAGDVVEPAIREIDFVGVGGVWFARFYFFGAREAGDQRLDFGGSVEGADELKLCVADRNCGGGLEFGAGE